MLSLVLTHLSISASSVNATPKNVVFRLIKGNDVNPFIESQHCLRRALAGSEPYDQVIFHEGLPEASQAQLLGTTSNLRFVDVSDDFSAMNSEASPPGLDADALGYRQMCHFMSMRWFRALTQYEIAMRVDDDVCLQHFDEDPFARMRRDGLIYAYGLETQERHLETRVTMPPFLSEYASDQGLELSDTADALVSDMFFTNFFVSRVDWWLSPRVQRFLQAVAENGGVFAHRWGDAPVQTAALRLFAPAEKVSRLPVDYLHVSTMNRIYSDGSEVDGWDDAEMQRHPLVAAFAARERRLSVADSSNMSNATNATSAMGAIEDAPEHYLLLEWTAETVLDDLSSVQAAIAEWAGVPPSSVTVNMDSHGDAADLGSGSAGGAGASPSAVMVSILFPTKAEAAAAVEAAGLELGSVAALRTLLVRYGLPAAAAASDPQAELYTLYSPPPPSPLPPSPPPSPPPPLSPPPPPPPSFPPASPRAEYEPLDEDKVGLDVEPGTFMGIAAGCLVGVVAFVLLGLRLAQHKSPLDCSVVPHARLGKAMLNWGLAATRFRIAIVTAVAIGFAVLAGLGLPRIEQDVGTASAWVPAGGRLEGQLKDWERLIDNSVTDRSYAYIVISSDKEGENLLDDPLRWLDAMLRTVKRAYADATVAIRPKGAGGEEELTLSWKDFCFSVNHPILTEPIPPLTTGTGEAWKPCINPSPLDAFREQMWEFNATDGTVAGKEKAESFTSIADVGAKACLLSQINGDGSYCGQVSDPSKFPSMYELDRPALIEQMMKAGSEAGHWINAASQPWGKLFGSYVGDNGPEAKPELRYVKSLVYTLYQDIPKEVVKHRKSVKGLTPEEFRDANEQWLLALETLLQQVDEDEANFPGVSVVYYPSDAITRMYEEVASAQSSTIAIGYAVMFAFVIVSQLSSRRCTNLALLGAAGFIAILFANAAAYGFIALLGFKYNHTMLQALPFLALGLGVDDLFLLLHAFKGTMREHRGVRAEVAVGLTMLEAGSSITITSLCNAAVFFVACLVPIPALQSLLVSAGIIVSFNWLCSMTLFPALLSLWAALFETAERRPMTTHELLTARPPPGKATKGEAAEGEAAAEPWWTPAELIARFYRLFSESLAAKLTFLLLGLGLLGGLAALIPRVEVGYKESDLAKKGSYLARGIDAMHEQIFSQHSGEIVVFGTGIDYTRDQAQILATHKRLSDTKWSAYGTALGRSGVSANHWLQNMYSSTGVCPHWNLYNDSVDPGWAFYEDFHLWRKPQVFLEPRYEPSSDSLSFGGLYAGLLDRVNEFPMSAPEGPDSYEESNHILMSFDQIEMDMTKLQKTEDKIAMVRDFKRITRESGLNIYMHGWLFVQIEQFLNLDAYFWQAAGISMLVVFAVSLLLGMSWGSALLIALFAVMLCVEVYGSLYLFDISYQPLACSSLLMSIGIAVEFVAHPVAAFEFATGNRRERLAEAMRRTALPVLEGAISSFLGFSFLAASEFLFVTKYFFYIFLSICLFGTINALVLLPAVLGIAGADKKVDDFRASAGDSTRPSGAEPRKSDAGSLESGEVVVVKAEVVKPEVAKVAAPGPVQTAAV